jgi:hypothetical protein
MDISEERQLREKLIVLTEEHRDLDEAINALEESGHGDPIQIHRMKKKKLALKDAISKLEDKLLPDIIA